VRARVWRRKRAGSIWAIEKNIRPKEGGKKIKDEKGGHGWAD
jgi:hypothetical protein